MSKFNVVNGVDGAVVRSSVFGADLVKATEAVVAARGHNLGSWLETDGQGNHVVCLDVG